MFVICTHRPWSGVTDWISCNRDNYQRLITPEGPFRHAGDWLLLCRARSDIIHGWKLLRRGLAECMLHIPSSHASHTTQSISMEAGPCIFTQLTVLLYITRPHQTAEDRVNLSPQWCPGVSTEMQAILNANAINAFLHSLYSIMNRN